MLFSEPTPATSTRHLPGEELHRFLMLALQQNTVRIQNVTLLGSVLTSQVFSLSKRKKPKTMLLLRESSVRGAEGRHWD